MKKILVFLTLIISSLIATAEETGTVYFVMGVPRVIGVYNGIKIIKCEPPYLNQICYSFTVNDPLQDGKIIVTCQGTQFEAMRNFSSVESADGTTYYLELVQ